MSRLSMYVEKFIGKKYDICGDIYKLIGYLPSRHCLYFQSVNDDTRIIHSVDRFNLDEYIKELTK